MDVILNRLRDAMEPYYPLSNHTWQALLPHLRVNHLEKSAQLYSIGEIPASFAFVCKGLFRAFVIDDQGNEYNKNFFDEGTFPGAMTALLTHSASRFAVEALEPSQVILINFYGYRQVLLEQEDLKLFHIYYLEQNWLLAKEAREVEIVQQNASERYQRFLRDHPAISARISQYHIASHLGITPTQLSRIRKKAIYQPM